MRKTVSNVLGSEYKVAIESEINKLKQSDQKLLGNLVAVVKRSDRYLGRPVEDCDAETEATFAISKSAAGGTSIMSLSLLLVSLGS